MKPITEYTENKNDKNDKSTQNEPPKPKKKKISKAGVLILPVIFDTLLENIILNLSLMMDGSPLPYQINYKQQSLIHPVSKQLYICLGNEKGIENFKLRERIREKIQKQYHQKIGNDTKILMNFSVGNQSTASISRNLFHMYHRKRLPYSKYSLFAMDTMDKYFTKPMTQSLYWTTEALENYYYHYGEFSVASGWNYGERMDDVPTILWSLPPPERPTNRDGIVDEIKDTTNPLNWFEKIDKDTHHFDVRRSYLTAILNYFDDKLSIPVYNVCDNIEHYDGGEIDVGLYLVSNYTIKGKYYEIPMYPQFLPHFEVKILMKKYGLKKKHIIYQYKPRKLHKAGLIREYVENVCKDFDGDEARELINIWSGTTKYSKVQAKYSFITQDKDFIGHYINWKRSLDIRFHRIKDYWIVYNEAQHRKTMDTTTIYQYIIGAGHLNMLSMLDECMTNKSILVGLKTDSVYIVGETNISDKFIEKDDIPKDMKSNVKHLKKHPYQIEHSFYPNDKKEIETKLDGVERMNMDTFISPIHEEDYDPTKDYSNDNILVQGDGGSGKSWELMKQYKNYKRQGKKVKVFAYTHSAVENLVDKIEEHEDGFEYDDEKEGWDWKKEMRNDSKTLDAWFGFEGTENEKKDTHFHTLNDDTEINKMRLSTNDFEVVLLDEYSMIGYLKYHHLLYRVVQESKKNRKKLKLKLFGDINQCPATDDIVYDVRKCDVLKNILGKKGYIVNMKYRKGANQRCDDKIMEVITSLKTTGKLPKHLFNENYEKYHKKRKKKYKRWITYYRKTTIENNAKIKNADELENGDIVISSKNITYYDEDEEKYKYIYNNQRLKVIEQRKIKRGEKYVIKLDLQTIPKDEKNGDIEIYKNITNEKITQYKKNGSIKYETYIFTLDKSETAYKYQGQTIFEPYIIQEGKEMSREMMITAFGRAKKFNQIYLENWEELLDKTFETAYKKKHRMKQIKNEDLKDMKTYRMYLLREIQENVKDPNNPITTKYYYVGHTEKKISERKQEHIDNEEEIWTPNCKMKLLGHFLAYNRMDAERCESMLIQDYGNMTEYDGWEMANEIYVDKESSKNLYEKSTNSLKLSLNDYMDRLLPINSDVKHRRIVCSLKNDNWEQKYKEIKQIQEYYSPENPKRKRKDYQSKAEAISIVDKARKEVFKYHFPTLYKELKKHKKL